MFPDMFVQLKTIVAKHEKLLDEAAMGKMKSSFEKQQIAGDADNYRGAVRVTMTTRADANQPLTGDEETTHKKAQVSYAHVHGTADTMSLMCT